MRVLVPNGLVRLARQTTEVAHVLEQHTRRRSSQYHFGRTVLLVSVRLPAVEQGQWTPDAGRVGGGSRVRTAGVVVWPGGPESKAQAANDLFYDRLGGAGVSQY